MIEGKSLMRFTHQCTGDLGIAVNGQVVAILFFDETRSTRTVYDVVVGGPGTSFPDAADALNHMIEIAQKAADWTAPRNTGRDHFQAEFETP